MMKITYLVPDKCSKLQKIDENVKYTTPFSDKIFIFNLILMRLFWIYWPIKSYSSLNFQFGCKSGGRLGESSDASRKMFTCQKCKQKLQNVKNKEEKVTRGEQPNRT